MVSRFKLLLQHLGLSAAEFASRIGVQRSGMSHILSGRNKPSIDFLEKTLAAFPELDANWLISGKGSWKKEPGAGPVAAKPTPENSDPPACREDGPVDHIIVVYKNDTFRILRPEQNGH